MSTEIPKFEYLRSEKHLNAIRNLRCWQCGSYPAQAAHSNQSKHGKGRGIKASDEFTIPLCQRCHESFDQTRNRQYAIEWFDTALVDVVTKLKAEGQLIPQAERLLRERGVLV